MRIQILALLSAVSLAGCYKDNGNYDYNPVNKIIVEGGKAPETLSVVFNDSLKITPTFEQTIPAAEADLMYEWTVYDNSITSPYIVPTDTVSRERNLSIKVTSPVFILGQSYRLGYKVTDKRTGIFGVHYYNLTIGNKYARGWIFLEQIGNNGDFSMLLPDGSVEHNIYTTINMGYTMGKPVKLELSAWSVTDDISAPSRRLYLLYENGGMELNYQTMQYKFDYRYLFFLPPVVQKPVVQTWMSSTPPGWTPGATMGIAINNGKVHANLVGGFPGTKKWGGILLTPEGTPNYTVAPYVVGGSTYSAIVHDNVGKRFLSVATSGLQRFPTQASTEFDMNNTGMDLLFMDSANVTRYYNAIMKDAAGLPWLLQFKAIVNTGETPVITLGKAQMNAPGAAQLTAAAGSTITPHVFYATGNKIMRHETTSNTTVEQHVFAGSEQVTSMKFKREPGGVSQLAVATWDGTAGRVYFFNVSNIGDLSLAANPYTGFGKIVDIGYKVP